MILSLACAVLALGAFWLTSVHPARNVLRLRRTLVSFFLLMGLLSLGLERALDSADARRTAALDYPVSAPASQR
jgi:hypothetical protein